MKVLVSLLVGILVSDSLQSQNLPNQFSIGNYVEVFDNDSILIYFNRIGVVVDKNCAKYYRSGKIDSVNINVSGKFYDYYMDHKIALAATMENNSLNGEATYYYENGSVKSNGRYKNDRKAGVWTFYYENGLKEKVINFVNDYPLIAESYSKAGKQMVFAGNGNYRGDFCTFKNWQPITIWGEVKNGKMDGKWVMYNSELQVKIGREHYVDGKFVKGVSGDYTDLDSAGYYSPNIYTYTDFPKIYIDGFCANENLYLDKSSFGCPGDAGVFLPLYKNSSINETFYPNLLDSLRMSIDSKTQNQWLIFGLKVGKKGELLPINIKSSINDIDTENRIYDIIYSMKDFTSAKNNGKKIDLDLFFTALISDQTVIIPVEYFYRTRKF